MSYSLNFEVVWSKMALKLRVRLQELVVVSVNVFTLLEGCGGGCGMTLDFCEAGFCGQRI